MASNGIITQDKQIKLTVWILVNMRILISHLLNQCCPVDTPSGLQTKHIIFCLHKLCDYYIFSSTLFAYALL